MIWRRPERANSRSISGSGVVGTPRQLPSVTQVSSSTLELGSLEPGSCGVSSLSSTNARVRPTGVVNLYVCFCDGRGRQSSGSLTVGVTVEGSPVYGSCTVFCGCVSTGHTLWTRPWFSL